MPHQSIPFFTSMKNAITTSGLSLFYIGDYLMMVLMVLNIITFALPAQTVNIIKGITEFSLGSSMIAQQKLPIMIQFSFISAILGFGGLYIHLQIFSLAEETQLNYAHFIFMKVIQALLSFALSLILLPLLH